MKWTIINKWKFDKWIMYAVLLIAGLCLGWLFFHNSASISMKMNAVETESSKKQIWTCSMHPQVREDHPGKCPICGMALIPLKENDEQKNDSNSIKMSEEAVALADIETSTVGFGNGEKQIRLFGKVQPDERLLQSQSAYVGGRIERLLVSAVGDHVSEGQTIAIVYSPELYTAEQELLIALHFGDAVQRKTMVDAAVEKLRLLNFTSKQINTVIRNRKSSPYVELKANTSGTVIVKNVNRGDYVNQGGVLLQIANLSKVWAVFQAYENDLPFIRKGETIHFTSEAFPGRIFSGVVSFIDPILDNQTRTVDVRVELSNPSGIFKPGMLLTGNVYISVGQYKGYIVIPKSAVLWTGKRSIVYVKDRNMSQPTFTMRQIILGPSLPDEYVVTNGLAAGEEIVTNGVFAVDASAQLEGKHSMMNQ